MFSVQHSILHSIVPVQLATSRIGSHIIYGLLKVNIRYRHTHKYAWENMETNVYTYVHHMHYYCSCNSIPLTIYDNRIKVLVCNGQHFSLCISVNYWTRQTQAFYHAPLRHRNFAGMIPLFHRGVVVVVTVKKDSDPSALSPQPRQCRFTHQWYSGLFLALLGLIWNTDDTLKQC